MEVAEEIKAYNDDEVEWGEDTSEEAQQKRMLELSAAAADLALTVDLEKTPQERADLFFKFVKVSLVYQIYCYMWHLVVQWQNNVILSISVLRVLCTEIIGSLNFICLVVLHPHYFIFC